MCGGTGRRQSGTSHPHTLTVTFPALVSINGVCLMPRQNDRDHAGDTRAFTIEVNNNGQEWRGVARGELVSTWAPQRIPVWANGERPAIALHRLVGFWPGRQHGDRRIGSPLRGAKTAGNRAGQLRISTFAQHLDRRGRGPRPGQTMKIWAFLIWLASATAAFGAGVTLTEDPAAYTLANGVITAKVNKRSADLVSLRYQGLELLGNTSGRPYGYWSHSPARLRETNSVTIDPARNGGARAEVSIKGYYTNRSSGFGFGSTAADIEIRYTLGRDDAGVYTYSIFTHPTNYPGTGVGEARFGVKLNPDVFDFLSIDSRRQRLMPKPEDWDNGTELNFKEARRLTTGVYKGQVEHKYDYSAIQFDIPAFGWSSTRRHVGLWFVNPSMEYLSGGRDESRIDRASG